MAVKTFHTEKFEYFCSRVVMAIGLLLFLFLSVSSLLYTEEFEANNVERLERVKDPVVWNLLWLFLLLLLLFYAGRWLLSDAAKKERNIRILLVFTCCYAVVYGLLWAWACRCNPFVDSEMVSLFADQLAHGIDALGPHELSYIVSYPHQMGLIALMELIYRIAGWENWHILQVINGFAAGGSVFTGYQIVRKLSKNSELGEVSFLFLMLGCHPLYIYVSFFYGELLSILFTLLSVYGLLRYLEKQGWKEMAFMAASISIACLIRSNCYIVLAAMGCVFVVKAVSGKRLLHILALGACIAAFLVSHTALIKAYEPRLGVPLDQSMPSILWVAMGLQEGVRPAGWYNGYSWDVYVEETGKDQVKSKEIARASIEESVNIFRNNPSYGVDFFGRKIFSQWNEPTFASQVETNHRDVERPKLMDRLYKGDLWKPFVHVMGIYQSLIYIGAFLFLFLWKKKHVLVEHLVLLIVIIGGFLFFTFWEAKSRYVFPYFVLMIPMAAIGFELLFKRVQVFCGQHQEKIAIIQRAVKTLPIEYLEPLAEKVILVAAGLPSVFLFIYSLFFTTGYVSNDLEIPREINDPFLLILIFVLLSLAVLHFAGKWILQKEEHRKRNINYLLGVVLAHCFIFCLCWNLFAGSALRGDPLYIHALAGGFANGDVPPSAMDYLYTYPHQAGQAFLLELVYRIFGYENLLAFRMLNTVGVLAFVFCGFQVTGELFHRDEIQVNFLILSAGCVPFLIYTNVIYGEVLAVAGIAFALWMLLLWLKEERIWQVLLMILSLSFAVYMKNNALIAAVAIGAVMLVKALSEKRKKFALWVFPMILVLFISQSAMTNLYESRGGWPLDQAMPKNLWIAMGLQGTGENAGWWNEFPVKVYKEDASYNPVTAREIGDAAIALSLQSFGENPIAAVRFFQQKFVSQWNNADYGCQVTAGSPKTPGLEFWMNGYHSLIFLGVSCFAILRLRRKQKIEAVLPLLILLGGYLFHIFWEVKGRYGLFYFVLVLPVAAAGLCDLTQYIRKRKEKRYEQKKESI